MEMEDKEKLYEEVQKIIEESISSYIKSTIEELSNKIGELKNRISEEIETKENEKLNEVQVAIEETVKSEEIADNVKTQAEKIAEESSQKLQESLDTIIKDKIDAKEKEFSDVIEKALKSKDMQEKISQEIINWIAEHKDFLTDVLEDKVKGIITEKKERDIVKNIEEFIKSGDFKDMIKLQFMNYLATSRDAFTNAAKEALREQIEREGEKVLKEAMKNVDSMVRDVVNNKLQETLGERLDSVIADVKNTIEELKKEVEELKIAVKEQPAASEAKTSDTEGTGEADEPQQLELTDNMEEHIEGLTGGEDEEVVEEEQAASENEQSEGKETEVATEEPEAQETVKRMESEGRGIRLTDTLRVKYYGHSSFLISNSDVKIIMDPYKKGALDGAINYEPIEDVADIVTVSHGHMDHAGWKEIPGNPVLVEAAGEKVIKGIRFKGVSAFHDKAHGALRGSNMIFVVEISGARLVHLGDLGHILTNDQVREIGLVDILMVPVGGYFTIDAEDAWQVVEQLDPLVVVPIHYKTQYVDLPVAELTPFINRSDDYGYNVEQFDNSELEIERLPKKKTVWILQPANVA